MLYRLRGRRSIGGGVLLLLLLTASPAGASEAAAELERRLSRNDLKGAIEFGNSVLAQHANDARFREQFGRAFFTLAERMIRTDAPLEKIDPVRQEAAKHLKAARADWGAVVPARIPLALSILETALGNPEAGAATATSGLIDHRGHAELSRVRAQARMALGEWDAAASDFENVLKAKPGDVEATIGWARTLGHRGRDCDAAAIVAQHCLQPATNPARQNWRAHYEHARFQITCGAWELAEPSLAEAARLNPDSALVAIGHAEALYRLQRVDAAKAVVDLWLGPGKELPRPQKIQAHYRRGRIAVNENEAPRAIAEFRAVLALDRWHEGALQGLGAQLLRSGEREEARTLLQRFRRVAPLALDLRILRNTIRRNPQAPKPRLDLIDTLLKIPDAEAATQEFEEFRSRFPRHRGLAETAKKIEAVRQKQTGGGS